MTSGEGPVLGASDTWQQTSNKKRCPLEILGSWLPHGEAKEQVPSSKTRKISKGFRVGCCREFFLQVVGKLSTFQASVSDKDFPVIHYTCDLHRLAYQNQPDLSLSLTVAYVTFKKCIVSVVLANTLTTQLSRDSYY